MYPEYEGVADIFTIVVLICTLIWIFAKCPCNCFIFIISFNFYSNFIWDVLFVNFVEKKFRHIGELLAKHITGEKLIKNINFVGAILN